MTKSFIYSTILQKGVSIVKRIILICLIILSLANISFAKTPFVSVEAELLTRHSDIQYGNNMYYLYHKDATVYIIMHGLENGKVMDGITVEKALNKILNKNKKKLEGKPINNIIIVCCFPKHHAGFYSDKWQANVTFVMPNCDKELVVYAGNRGFRYSEYEKK